MSVTAIEFRISPSLHPTCANKFSEIHPVKDAFVRGHSALTTVYSEKDRISKDTSLSLEGQTIAIQQIADRHKAVITDKFASTKLYLDKSIDALRQRLSDTLVKNDAMAAEIRAHYKTEDKRESLLREVMNNGDIQTISAVLVAPGYLSGLTNEQQSNLLQQYYESVQPKLSSELATMEEALQTVIRAQDIIPMEFKKAGGS